MDEKSLAIQANAGVVNDADLAFLADSSESLDVYEAILIKLGKIFVTISAMILIFITFSKQTWPIKLM